MNKRQSAALSNQSRSETIPCAGYELVTTLTCAEADEDRNECWKVQGALTKEGVPVETKSLSDKQIQEVWAELVKIVKGIGHETGQQANLGRLNWTLWKEMTDEEVEKITGVTIV